MANEMRSGAGIDPQQLAEIQRLTHGWKSDQLQWLSGYLSGLAATGVPVAAASEDQLLTILYGSQTGNSRSIAEELHEAAQTAGLSSDLISMGKFKEKQLKKIKNMVVIVSTQGEGDPPDDALDLVDFINGPKAPKLNELQFGVLALGDSSYEFYCKTGKDFDQRLEELGGKRLLERVDLDVDFDDAAEAWIAQAITTFKEVLPETSSSTLSAPVIPTTSGTKYTRKKPLATQLLTNQKITGRDSDKDIRHIEIDLEDSGLRYQPGDALGVWFKNSASLVDRMLALVEIDPDTEVTVGDESVSISQALVETYELTQLHPAFVQDYAELTDAPELRQIAADADALKKYIADRQIIDVIHEYPAALDADALISSLRKLTPRLYSIASSQAEVEEEVHLTVGVVDYEINGFEHLGGASGHLSQLQAGEEVRVYVEANDHFRLPADPTTPTIMIGPGTGIAPFRAFLQERAASEASGENWIFFGNPHFTEDFLYQTEWQTHLDEGTLQRISLAFSRDQADKIYVQDRMLEEADELWRWLERGAHLYVCGDESRMAKDVQQALLSIIEKQGGKSAEEAADFLDQLRREGRYQKDVY